MKKGNTGLSFKHPRYQKNIREVSKQDILNEMGINHQNTMTTKQAAKYLTRYWGLPHAPSTLEVYRSYGKGPSYLRVGPRRIFYKIDALDKYASGVEIKTIEIT